MQNSQKAIRDAMNSNTQSGKSNAGKLPKISTDISSIIGGYDFQNVSWLGENRGQIEQEMETVFMDFCRRYKKYTKSELSESDMESLYEEFVLNYESIGVYMKNNKIGNTGDREKLSQFWDSDFISNYFGNDETIGKELGISLEEVRENFGRSVKLYFAINNISDPMEALGRVKKNLDETLSDENIGKELGISLEEVRENFGRSVKLRFAINNISDPMEALRRVKKHLDETLSDENIGKEFGISLVEVQENFGRSVKLHFAVGNISDPMEALRRVKKHLDETLSDENIGKEFGISQEEVQENFGRSVKLHFAIYNISDPMEALRRVKKHLDETLSDENIGKELGISQEEVQENFGRSVKLRFAIYNISDPMEGCKKWKSGIISIFRAYK